MLRKRQFLAHQIRQEVADEAHEQRLVEEEERRKEEERETEAQKKKDELVKVNSPLILILSSHLVSACFYHLIICVDSCHISHDNSSFRFKSKTHAVTASVHPK